MKRILLLLALFVFISISAFATTQIPTDDAKALPTLEISHEKIMEAVSSFLTEVKSFPLKAVEGVLYDLQYLPEERIWVAACTFPDEFMTGELKEYFETYQGTIGFEGNTITHVFLADGTPYAHSIEEYHELWKIESEIPNFSLEQALEIATAAVVEKYGVKETSLYETEPAVRTWYSGKEPTIHEYRITFNRTGLAFDYAVVVDAKNGDILVITDFESWDEGMNRFL